MCDSAACEALRTCSGDRRRAGALFGWNGLFELGGFGAFAFALDLFAGGGAIEGLDLAEGEFAEGAGGDI